MPSTDSETRQYEDREKRGTGPSFVRSNNRCNHECSTSKTFYTDCPSQTFTEERLCDEHRDSAKKEKTCQYDEPEIRNVQQSRLFKTPKGP